MSGANILGAETAEGGYLKGVKPCDGKSEWELSAVCVFPKASSANNK